ncbi:serum paraoxonase/arylesterase 2-like isoform X2 [Micropterus dolomieu]|uniref:serum paraoxonase/arylesterase 2-like isoform X2 n=1 Tax=Micropterus dolomieu TaxID=147949 RepID=UPI001E8CA0A2|nr:serum paraoxonase/arylesterase 2-like isoform X2 [Micropterus dolomieu]
MRRIQGVNVNQHICYYISDSPEGSTAHAVACLGFSNQAKAIVRKFSCRDCKMGKLVFISLVIAALSVLFGERIISFRRRTFASRELVQNHLPNCVALKNLDHGSEDITILGDGLAFISTGLKYPGLPSSEETGKIFSLDMQDPRMKPVELRMPRNFDLESFNPHGISVYTDTSDDTIYLFVVNHPQHKSQVELFRFVEDSLSLVHLKTIKHELLYSVNDIVAVGVESFYATNDHYFTHEIFKGLVEPLLAQPWTNVVYYSPEEVKVVSEGYYFANGINISPDKRHIYVVDLFDHNVHVLKRKEDNALVSVKVINIKNIHSYQPVVTQVYADNGHVIMGSSVAATYGGKLLIGSVFHKAICCDLK